MCFSPHNVGRRATASLNYFSCRLALWQRQKTLTVLEHFKSNTVPYLPCVNNLSSYIFISRWQFISLVICTEKNQCRKFETNLTSKGNAQPKSQFPHSCVCEQFIYSHDWSAYSPAGKYGDLSLECLNRSQTHEHGNWTKAAQFPEKEYMQGARYICTRC